MRNLTLLMAFSLLSINVAFGAIPLCTAPGVQDEFVLAAGDSFAVVVWRDSRNDLTSSFDIYGEAIWRRGPRWAPLGQGAPISVAAGQQDEATVSVGVNGIVSVAWRDGRACGPTMERIFTQDLLDDGTPLFTVNGEALEGSCYASGRGSRAPGLLVVSGGAHLLSWGFRGAGSGDLRVFRRPDGVNASTCSAVYWPVPWFGCIPTPTPLLVPDGEGGMISVFRDDCPSCPRNIHVRRVDAACNVSWSESSAYCVGDENFQIPPRVTKQGGRSGGVTDPAMTAKGNHAAASDGAGGVIVVWEDGNAGSREIRAQRFDAAGVRQWGDLGKVIAAGGDSRFPQIVRSTSGRSFILWERVASTSESDLFAQRINLLGDTLGARVPICTAPLTQTHARASAAPGGGCFVVWEDRREMVSGDLGDIYVQKLDAAGNIMCSANGVQIPTPAETRQYEPKIVSVPIEFVRSGSSMMARAVVVWRDDRNGNPDLYTWMLEDACPLIVLDAEVSGSVESELRIESNPNPFQRSTKIAFELSQAGRVTAGIFDIGGRRVRSLVPRGTTMSAGRNATEWDGRTESGEDTRDGVYFLRLEVDGVLAIRRIVRVK
jgi:hypothetical protein